MLSDDTVERFIKLFMYAIHHALAYHSHSSTVSIMARIFSTIALANGTTGAQDEAAAGACSPFGIALGLHDIG